MAFITWALKRQVFYIILLLLILAVFGFIIAYPYFNKPPSCMDNKQNGTETGVDCGGSCSNACSSQESPVALLWSRAFEVVPGRYNAVAYLENHNKDVAVNKINYRFRFADANNVYIGKREGSTYVPPSGRFAIFEPAIDLGNSVPVYTTFTFTEAPLWQNVSEDKINQLKVLTSDIQLTGESSSPRLSATIKNKSLFTIPNVNVVVILYDASGNAVQTSSTYLSALDGGESKDVSFTWPEPFDRGIVAKEILPLFNILSVQLK